jgi:chromosome segregation ATPase
MNNYNPYLLFLTFLLVVAPKVMNEENCKLRQEIMSVEQEMSVSKGRIKTLELSLIDHEKLEKNHANLMQDLMSMKNQLMESLTIMKDAARQKDRYKREYESLKEQLNSERRDLSDFKTMNERNLSRLRKCIQEERSGYEERIRKLEDEVRSLGKEKNEIEKRYHQSKSILDQIRTRVTTVEKNFISNSPEKNNNKNNQHQQHLTRVQQKDESKSNQNQQHLPQQPHPQQQQQTQSQAAVISPECHQKLRRQYKDLKRKQSELTRLLNSLQVQ